MSCALQTPCTLMHAYACARSLTGFRFCGRPARDKLRYALRDWELRAQDWTYWPLWEDRCVVCRVGQNRVYTPYMTVYSIISLPNIPYTRLKCMVLANPTGVWYNYKGGWTRTCDVDAADMQSQKFDHIPCQQALCRQPSAEATFMVQLWCNLNHEVCKPTAQTRYQIRSLVSTLHHLDGHRLRRSAVRIN